MKRLQISIAELKLNIHTHTHTHTQCKTTLVHGKSMYVYVSMNLYIHTYIYIYMCLSVCLFGFFVNKGGFMFCTWCRIWLLHCVLSSRSSLVQSGLLLLLHHRLYCLITGTLSSRMLELVIVVARMANIDLQNAPNYVQQMNQHPVKKACLMLCLTLDGCVCYMKVHLCFNPVIALSHKKTSDFDVQVTVHRDKFL